jgi:hypothetical protein
MFNQKRFDLASELVKDFVDNPPDVSGYNHIMPLEVVGQLYTLTVDMGRQTGHTTIVKEMLQRNDVFVIVNSRHQKDMFTYAESKHIYTLKQISDIINSNFVHFRGIKHTYKAIIIDSIEPCSISIHMLYALSIVLAVGCGKKFIPIVVLGS